MYISKYFKDDEFTRISCTRAQVSDDSLRRLDRAREIAGIPFYITSAYRSPEKDLAAGRSGKGAHTLGKAFDIGCTDSRSRWLIVFGAISAGFTRIGIGRSFIHMDDAFDLPSPRIWLY